MSIPFATLPDLPAGIPCQAVPPAEQPIDLEYTPFSLPIQYDASAETMREQLQLLRHALAPFASVGRMYRQNGASLHRMVLSVDSAEGEAVVSVKDFTNAADVLK